MTVFREKPNAIRRWLAATFALAALLGSARGQTIEGQPIAAEFGEYQVADEGNGFSFAPNQCNVIGAGMNFPAFTTGVPVKVWDPQPGFTEVSTAVTAFVNGSECAVSLGGLVHPHLASFYLTSGTGGLQEALNNVKVTPGITNTIILNAEWYSLIQPRSAATVIASVTGNASLGLVDITTNPYTSYSWNGTHYVVASEPGSGVTFPTTTGLIFNTSPTSSRSATSADVAGIIAGATIGPANLNGTVYAAGVNGAGIGVAQTAWSSSTAYPQCAAVASGGSNYLAVAANTNVTPGTNSSVWWQVPNAGTPTNGDCSFYIAASQVNGAFGAELDLPPGNTNTCIGFMEPTVTSPGNPNVVIHGAGKSASTLTQTCNILSSGNAVVQQPDSGVPYALAGIDWEGFTVNANHLASAAMNVYGAQQFKIKHMRLENPADGSDHYIEFGHPAAADHAGAWTYEMDLEDIDTVNSHGPGTGASITATVSGGVPTFTVVNGGASYNPAYSQLILSGTGANADVPCSSRGTDTINVSGGVITSITTTATGCASPLYASVFGGNAVTYCFKFNDASDSKMIMALTPSECNTGVYNSNITSLMSFLKTHPIGTMTGIVDAGNNNFWATQMDTIYRYGFDFEGAANVENVYGSLFERATNLLPGSSDYHFGTIANSPVNSPYAINIFGDACGTSVSFNGYNHFLPSSGSVESGGGLLPAFVHAYNSVSCDQTSTPANAANYIGQNFSLGNGSAGSVFNLGLGGGTGGAISLTYPSNGGVYNWSYQNATAATSGNNASSPQVQIGGNYWNGTASTPAYAQLQTLFGSGSNPAQTLQFTMGGTPSSGTKSYAFDNPVTEANAGTFGSTNYSSFLNAIISGSGGSSGNCSLNGGTWYLPITAAVYGCITAPAIGTGTKTLAGGVFAAETQENDAVNYQEPVGIIGVGTALANGGSVYGANLIAQDGLNCCTSSIVLVGQENDIQPTSASGPSAYLDGVGFRAQIGFTNGNTGTYPFQAYEIGSNQAGAYWRSGLVSYVGAFGPSSVLFNINALGTATPTSGNYNCPTFLHIYEAYWTGTANAYPQWDINCSIGTGTTPSDSFKISNAGGAAGASHYFDLMGGIQLELDGATSGSAYLSASATGGTLNLGSTNATVTSAGALTVASCTGCGSVSSGLSGMTAGQIPVAATPTTVTSSMPLAGSGAAIVTGPATSTSGDLPTYSTTSGQTQDSGTALSSLATNAALTSYAPLASPVFTGTPTAPTQAISTNNTDIATTAAVTTAISSLAPLASPAFTGTPTAPTQAVSTNNTDVATTAAVTSALALYTPTSSLGTFATQNYATPPAIGGTTPNAGSFSSLSSTGQLSNSAAGAASSPGVSITGAPYTSGTATTNFPQLYVNSGAAVTNFSTAGTMFGVNAPSGFSGNLVDMYVNGATSLFSISSTGAVLANIGGFSTSQSVTGAGGIFGRGTSPLNAQTTAAATSSACSSPGALKFLGYYWNGSASTSDTISLTPSCTPGANGAETLTVANSGSAGTFTFQNNGVEIESGAGAASTPGVSITGAPYTGGTATTNFPQLYLNQGAAVTTLSTAGTELGINAPSGFTGHLMNLFVNGGSTRFRVDYAGNTFVAGTATVASNLGLSSTTAPTIVNGAGAGTSPGTPTVTGNNNSGVITVITGTATAASATLATVTFNGTLGTVPNGCGLTPRNAAATGATLFYTTAPTSTSFTIGVGGTAAAASTTYSWSYLCL